MEDSLLKCSGDVEQGGKKILPEMKLYQGDISHAVPLTGGDAGQEVWDKTSSQEAEVVC